MKPVLAYHAIFSAYGFWLPNDPRGSWSEFVGSWNLFRHGPATKTNETRSLASQPHDRAKRLAAKEALLRPAVLFSDKQITSIADGFAEYVQRSGLPIWACAIMPDHVHIVVGRFRLKIESIIVQLKAAATRKMLDAGIHPFQSLQKPNGQPEHCWSRGEWSVFLDSPDDIIRSMEYAERNPEKEGRSRQTWSFVKKYDPMEVYSSQFDHAKHHA